MDKKLRFYRGENDLKGEHREYIVHQDGGKFIFDCYEWGPRNGNVNAAIRKQNLEFDTEEEAFKEYRHYITTWEEKVVE